MVTLVVGGFDEPRLRLRGTRSGSLRDQQPDAVQRASGADHACVGCPVQTVYRPAGVVVSPFLQTLFCSSKFSIRH
jgi:hypothetical protein